MKKLKVYTDGACKLMKDKTLVGGWGYIICDKEYNIEQQANGKLRKGPQSAIRAELEAFYQVLLIISKYKSSVKFDIYCDNESLVSGVIGYSERKSNRDLWDKIEPLCNKIAGRFRIHNIISHQKGLLSKDEEMNKYTDKLARIGVNSLMLAPAKN